MAGEIQFSAVLGLQNEKRLDRRHYREVICLPPPCSATCNYAGENTPYYCLEGLDEKRRACRAKGQAVASSAGQLVSKARLASGVKWTNGWPTHTTLAPQAIDAALVALIEPTGYSPG
ncbi:uncharacterized protein Triagg1_7006 [Trichoderma aggressivum f. europaeum]|uniref:Uncharacterized protein n=1 Tax=Trichoderma aggressivum f. europaeum TaxID=173218 RepID=A0AAE1IC21_9HYPO|nr:hypothetical protein Triagg1_7006 [Trichoderma aggressivum f. europaeum]